MELLRQLPLNPSTETVTPLIPADGEASEIAPSRLVVEPDVVAMDKDPVDVTDAAGLAVSTVNEPDDP